ncbi:hypothetical protein RB195_022370 [Necator americanus]|uniref:Secreted protein n=1 Tax=Necator americanus TaxID=51031 RepID=A0ABR1EF21_NECAM
MSSLEIVQALYMVLLTTSVLSLRGALYRSGRSFRFRQPTVVEHDALVETKRNAATPQRLHVIGRMEILLAPSRGSRNSAGKRSCKLTNESDPSVLAFFARYSE